MIEPVRRLRALMLRLGAVSLAGAAALLAVSSLRAQIEDLSALFGAARADGGYRRLADEAAAACGALGAERESCEMAVMRLAPAGSAADAGPPGLETRSGD